MFGVRPDRFDHQVESVEGVDFARYTAGLARPDLLGFGEIVQSRDTLCVAILDQEHRTRQALRPRE